MIIYLTTFILCLVADLLPEKYSLFKKGLLVWLYIFLCFGYMTGSDWRNYELIYYQYTDKELLSSQYERGFYYLIYFARQLITDFWIFIALVKVLYLYSVVKFIKLFTNKIFIVLALMLNVNLLFMLVDNPLRFMIGSTLLIAGTRFLLNKNIYKYIIIGLLSVFFHISLVLPFLLGLTVYYRNYIINKGNRTLVSIYVVFGLISFFPSVLNTISAIIAENEELVANKLLYAYNIESIDSLFTIGSVLNILLFLVVLKYRDDIRALRYGDEIFYFTLTYFFLFRILIIFPTGFRLYLHFALFYCITLATILKSIKFRKYKKILLLSIGVLLIRNLWFAYQFIPYSNSIGYIITGNHPTYNYRSNYNKLKYTERTGEVVEEYIFMID